MERDLELKMEHDQELNWSSKWDHVPFDHIPNRVLFDSFLDQVPFDRVAPFLFTDKP